MSTTFILIVEVINKSVQIKYNYLPPCELIILHLRKPCQGQEPIHATLFTAI